MYIEFKSEIIKKIVYNKLKKDENSILKIQELDSIKSITLNNLNKNGQKINYNFLDFEYLQNLESLTLNSFQINNEIITLLNTLKHLKTLILNHCSFETDKTVLNNLEYLAITHCTNLNLSIFNRLYNIKILQIINADEININEILFAKNLENLFIHNSNIKNCSRIKDFLHLKQLKIDGSFIDSPNFVELLNKDIKFSYNKRYYLS